MVGAGVTDTILLTGDCGFIASHFAHHVLETTDYAIVGVDRLDEAGSQQRIAELSQRFQGRFQHAWHDLRAAVNPLCSWAKKEYRYVVHMAAASHVTRSIKNPMGFVLDNVVGTAHLLELCTHLTPQKILYFSTDEVFGGVEDPAFPGFDDYAPHNPTNPYAASKAAGEALCPAWANTYGLPIVITHCTNAYGPHQSSEKFIPMVVQKVLRGEVVSIHSRNGVPSSRYYVHVDDISRATMMALEKGGIWCGPNTGRYNISGLRDHSNFEVAQQVAEVLGMTLHHELGEAAADRPRHDQRYAIRDERLTRLGWCPRVPFNEGLRQTVESYL